MRGPRETQPMTATYEIKGGGMIELREISREKNFMLKQAACCPVFS